MRTTLALHRATAHFAIVPQDKGAAERIHNLQSQCILSGELCAKTQISSILQDNVGLRVAPE